MKKKLFICIYIFFSKNITTMTFWNINFYVDITNTFFKFSALKISNSQDTVIKNALIIGTICVTISQIRANTPYIFIPSNLHISVFLSIFDSTFQVCPYYSLYISFTFRIVKQRIDKFVEKKKCKEKTGITTT